jgi:DNA polymerase-3 subunit gamma/tau
VSAPEQQTRTPGLALYRKYRSATFAEVIGQEHVTGPLSAALDAGRINHAYLFSGPRGCGKTSSARILARSLNCVQGPTATPCGVCDSCRELAPNGPGSIDVIEIDAASHGGVDDARELRERAFYAPVRDRFKVYIIDEAHMVSAQGFNALLKLVEEPPDFLVFVFATTEPDKVLQTIRSRTHHYPFRLLPPSAMRKHLEHICAAEGVTVEPTVLPLVVRAGGGSARDALSILDQLLAGAGPNGVTYADAVALLGVTDSGLLDDMVDALAAGDAKAVYATVDRVVEAGHDPRRFAADLLERLRDLLLLDAVPDAATNGLLDLPADALARMSEQSSRIGRASGVRYAEILHAALVEMRGTTAPRLVLELVCARMLLPDASADSAALLQRLERLERRNELLDGGGPEPPPVAEPLPLGTAPAPQGRARAAPPKHEPAKHEPAPDDAGPARTETAIDAADLRRIWPEVLDRVKQVNRTTRALLETTQVTAVDGAAVTLSIATEPLSRLLSTEANLEVITSAISSLIAGGWHVNVVVAGAAEPKPTPVAEESDPRGDDNLERAGAHSAEDAALALLADELGAQPMPSDK